MSDRHIHRYLLAQGLVAQVEYCENCDVFYLNVDSLTVRFRPAALRDLRDTLSIALANLERLPGTLEPSAPDPRRPRQEVH